MGSLVNSLIVYNEKESVVKLFNFECETLPFINLSLGTEDIQIGKKYQYRRRGTVQGSKVTDTMFIQNMSFAFSSDAFNLEVIGLGTVEGRCWLASL